MTVPPTVKKKKTLPLLFLEINGAKAQEIKETTKQLIEGKTTLYNHHSKVEAKPIVSKTESPMLYSTWYSFINDF